MKKTPLIDFVIVLSIILIASIILAVKLSAQHPQMSRQAFIPVPDEAKRPIHESLMPTIERFYHELQDEGCHGAQVIVVIDPFRMEFGVSMTCVDTAIKEKEVEWKLKERDSAISAAKR